MKSFFSLASNRAKNFARRGGKSRGKEIAVDFSGYSL